MSQKIFGIDFGTGTIKIYKKNQGIILLERNVVSVVGKEKRPVAIGEKAYEMYEKEPPSMHVSFPLSHGVIAHMQDMISLWNYMNVRISEKKKIKGYEYYLAVPADITEVEKQAYSKIISESEVKPKKVFLIDKPVASAFGLGIDVENTRGVMIIDVGADTTEISILSLGGIVVTKLLPYGGNYLDNCIKDYLRKGRNFLIGSRSAEQLKKALVSVNSLDGQMVISGRDVVKGLPGELTLTSKEIEPLVTNMFRDIVTSSISMMEHTPPEILSQIRQDGVHLIGGSSNIPGLTELLSKEMDVQVHKHNSPQEVTVKGLGYLTENTKLANNYKLAIKVKKNK